MGLVVDSTKEGWPASIAAIGMALAIYPIGVERGFITHGKHCGWLSPWHYGINEGPIVLTTENHRTAFLWELMKKCPYIVTGLRRAGFKGGWL